MSQQIPVVDLEVALGEVAPAGLLDAVRSAAEHVGVIQVVNHGVPGDLLADFIRRMGHLLSLPRADKARLASPGGHPYRGWRQWPDDYGRLELERYNVAQFDTPADARAAGVSAEYLGLYVHPNVWPPDDPQLRAAARSPVSRLPAGWRSACPSCTPGRSVSPRIPSRSAPPRTPPHLRLTTNDYPPWSYPDVPSDEDKLLLFEHADDSVLTVPTQEGGYEGLQVQLPDGGCGAAARRPAPRGRRRHDDPAIDGRLLLSGPGACRRAAAAVRRHRRR